MVTKNFGNHIYKLNKEQNFDNINVDIDNLLIDMNGIFHNSAQKYINMVVINLKLDY